MPLFTVDNAANMAAKAHIARRMRKEQSKDAEYADSHDSLNTPPAFAIRLMRAQEEKLDELLACRDAKECASLAQALRHLRETYHMVTGLAKPGVTKPSATRQPKRNYASQGPPANWDTPVPVQSQFAPSTNATTQVDASNHAQHTAAPLPEACADYCI